MNDYHFIPDDDPWETPSIGQPLHELLSQQLEPKDKVHPWLPGGLTLLGGKSKAGKSTFAEQIAEEVSQERRVLYLALEYNKRTAQGRFARFTAENRVFIVVEGQMDRMGNGGNEQLDEIILKYGPDLIIVDVLAKLKRQNTGTYDAEYAAMSELKELVDQYDKDCLVLTHTRKPAYTDGDDPFDAIIGSTAFQGVPDNLMILAQNSSHTKLNTKGRLIFPSEKVLTFENGKYSESTGVGIELQDEAPLQAQILRLLATHGALRVSELAKHLQRSDPQISAACSKLQDKNKIVRKDRTMPYQLA